MKWRSPRFFLPVLLVVVLGIVGVIIYIHTITSQGITVAWQIHPSTFTQQDQQDLQDSLKSALLTTSPQGFPDFHFHIISAKRQGEWAILDAVADVGNSPTSLATEPLFAIAHKQGSNWGIWIENSPHFCDQLKQIPDALLNVTSKHYFLGCYQ